MAKVKTTISVKLWFKEFGFALLLLFSIPVALSLIRFIGLSFGYSILILVILCGLWFSSYRTRLAKLARQYQNRLWIVCLITILFVLVWNIETIRSLEFSLIRNSFLFFIEILKFYFGPIIMSFVGFVAFFVPSPVNVDVDFQQNMLLFSLFILFTALLPVRCFYIRNNAKRQLLWMFWSILWGIESLVIFVLLNSAAH